MAIALQVGKERVPFLYGNDVPRAVRKAPTTNLARPWLEGQSRTRPALVACTCRLQSHKPLHLSPAITHLSLHLCAGAVPVQPLTALAPALVACNHTSFHANIS